MRLPSSLRALAGSALLAGLLSDLVAAQAIDLGDVTAGGDGSGNAPAPTVGIDPRNGAFVTSAWGWTFREGDPEGDGLSPSPGPTEFIDSVFLIGPVPPGDPPPAAFLQPITMSGVAVELPSADGIGTMYNYILRDANGGETLPPIAVGGEDRFTSAVGIHSSGGITYRLDALRVRHGAGSVGCFSAFWGLDDSPGDATLHAILSDDGGPIARRSFHATRNQGERVEMDIPEGAIYLTLATGSNGPDSWDHGTFAQAAILPGPCGTRPIERIGVEPGDETIDPSAVLQLETTGYDAAGNPTDLTAAATGTSYSSAPPGVVAVGPDGLVTGLAPGTATVTAENGSLSGAARIHVIEHIDLGNIAAGGDGRSPAPPGTIGIEADSGSFLRARTWTEFPETDGLNPHPVDGSHGSGASPFIDCVFVMDSGIGQRINLAGVAFDFDPGDAGPGWEGILDHREPDGPDFLRFGTLGPFTKGLGMHAAQGITFDLTELRSRWGEDSVRHLSAVAGEASAAGGHVNAYVVLSDDGGVLEAREVLHLGDRGELVQMEIPPDAAYATFAVGAAGDGIGADHGGFGLAWITAEPISANVASLEVAPPAFRLGVGEEVQLELSGPLAVTQLAGTEVSVDPALATYSSASPAVASVDTAGRVRGRAGGRTTIEVGLGSLNASVTVDVGPAIDLGDVVAGGDGSGSAPAENVGVDPRNGAFVTYSVERDLRETDAEGDGLNPSPVPTSDYLDSVFILGPAEDEGGERFEQLITRTGIGYEFPTADGIGVGYNFILRDRNGGLSSGPVRVGGLRGFRSAVGIHASMGVTFDLDALRSRHGDAGVHRFTTFCGLDGGGDATLYAILSSDAGGILVEEAVSAAGDSGRLVEMDIPPEAGYLTLAAGSNGVPWSDHGTFANAYILPDSVAGPPRFVRGDADGDQALNLTDGIFVLNYLFLGGPAPPCLDASDTNDSGGIDLTDGIYVFNYLFLGGPAPPAPTTAESAYGADDCGTDPDEDELDCATPPPVCR